MYTVDVKSTWSCTYISWRGVYLSSGAFIIPSRISLTWIYWMFCTQRNREADWWLARSGVGSTWLKISVVLHISWTAEILWKLSLFSVGVYRACWWHCMVKFTAPSYFSEVNAHLCITSCSHSGISAFVSETDASLTFSSTVFCGALLRKTDSSIPTRLGFVQNIVFT